MMAKSDVMGGNRATLRRSCMRVLLCLPLLPVASTVQAMRVSDVPIFATLNCIATAKLGGRECIVAKDSHVELVAEVGGLGSVAGSDRRWFARVVIGPCAGAELTVPESCLRDQRSQPEPPPAAKSP